jgi:hypothetical protein
MKSNIHSTELQDDKVAAIGIGAMIVFIALILGCSSRSSSDHPNR